MTNRKVLIASLLIILFIVSTIPTDAYSNNNVVLDVEGYLKAPGVVRYNVNLTELNSSFYYNIHLYVPQGADFDLFLKNNRTGEEVASSFDKYWSTDTLGKDEIINYRPNTNDTFTIEIYAYELTDSENNITYSNEGNYRLVVSIEKATTIADIVTPWILPIFTIILCIVAIYILYPRINKIISKAELKHRKTKEPIIDDVNRFIESIEQNKEIAHEIISKIIKNKFHQIQIAIKPDDLFVNIYIQINKDMTCEVLNSEIDQNFDITIRGLRKDIEKLLSAKFSSKELRNINDKITFEISHKKQLSIVVSILPILIKEAKMKSIDAALDLANEIISQIITNDEDSENIINKLD